MSFRSLFKYSPTPDNFLISGRTTVWSVWVEVSCELGESLPTLCESGDWTPDEQFDATDDRPFFESGVWGECE